MTSLAEGLISVKDFSLTILLPAILVFVIIYAILAKTEVLGGNQWVDATLSAIVAIMFVAIIKAVNFTNEFIPLITVALIIIIFLFMLLRFVGVEGAIAGGWKVAVGIGVGVLVLILSTVAFSKSFTKAYDKFVDALSGAWQAVSEPEVAAVIILFTALILSAWLVARKG